MGGCQAALFMPTAAGARQSAGGAAPENLRPRIPLGAGRTEGSAETPLVMNREISRPAGALQTGGTAGIGQSASHLIERRLCILLAEAGIRRVSCGQRKDRKR